MAENGMKNTQWECKSDMSKLYLLFIRYLIYLFSVSVNNLSLLSL